MFSCHTVCDRSPANRREHHLFNTIGNHNSDEASGADPNAVNSDVFLSLLGVGAHQYSARKWKLTRDSELQNTIGHAVSNIRAEIMSILSGAPTYCRLSY